MTKELKRKDERLFEFENQLLYYKTMNSNDRYFLNLYRFKVFLLVKMK